MDTQAYIDELKQQRNALADRAAELAAQLGWAKKHIEELTSKVSPPTTTKRRMSK